MIIVINIIVTFVAQNCGYHRNILHLCLYLIHDYQRSNYIEECFGSIECVVFYREMIKENIRHIESIY